MNMESKVAGDVTIPDALQDEEDDKYSILLTISKTSEIEECLNYIA